MIQDSDDEDDPLCEVPTSPDHQDPVMQDAQNDLSEHSRFNVDTGYATNGYTQGNGVNISHATNDSNGLASSQPGVNFDDFLKSQDSGPAWLSSQRRREERWIPNTGRTESIGTFLSKKKKSPPRLTDVHYLYRGDDD